MMQMLPPWLYRFRHRVSMSSRHVLDSPELWLVVCDYTSSSGSLREGRRSLSQPPLVAREEVSSSGGLSFGSMGGIVIPYVHRSWSSASVGRHGNGSFRLAPLAFGSGIVSYSRSRWRP